MKKFISLIGIIGMHIFSPAQNINSLNNLLSSYTSKHLRDFGDCKGLCLIKNIKAERQGEFLFLFCDGENALTGDKTKEVTKINLTTASFFIGHVQNSGWHDSDDDFFKVTIKDENGIENTSKIIERAIPKYSKGEPSESKSLESILRINFYSKPLANKVLEQIKSIQKPFKQSQKSKISSSKTNNYTSTSKNTESKTLGKYVQ